MIAAAVRLGQKQYRGDEVRANKAGMTNEEREQLRQSWRDTIAAYRPPGETYLLFELGHAFPRPEPLGPGPSNKLSKVLKLDPAGRFDVFDGPGGMCVRVRGNEHSVVEGVEALEVDWRQRAATLLAGAAQDKAGISLPLRRLEQLCPGPKQLPPSCRLRDVLEEDPERRFAVSDSRSGPSVCLRTSGARQETEGVASKKNRRDHWLSRMMDREIERGEGWASGTVDDEMRERIEIYLRVSSSRPSAGSAAPLARAIVPRAQAARLSESQPNQGVTQRNIPRNLERNLEKRKLRNQMADEFYALLDADRSLMQRCSDPIIFREEFMRWKSQSGNTHAGLAPSLLLTLWRSKRLVLHRGQNPNDVIIFKVLVARDQDGNRTMADILEEQRVLVAEGRRDIEADRGGISITKLSLDMTQDGKERVMHPGTNLERTLLIANTNPFDVLLTEARVLKNAQDAFHCLPPAELPLRIEAGGSIAVIVDVTPRFSGVLRSIFGFSFRYELDLIGSEPVSFMIGRFAQVRCCNPDNFAIVKPSSPYVKAVKRRNKRRPEREIVEGVRPEGGGTRWLNDCPEYKVPNDVVEMVRSGQAEDKLLDMQQAVCEPGGYARLFQNLLWVEELSMLDDIATFNMEKATLRPDGAYLALQVPGLAEKRPSVLKGDSIVATPNGVGKGYRGYVHHVERDSVKLKFHSSFHAMYGNIKGMTFEVEFTFRRTNLKLMHQGLSACGKVPRQMLFPEPNPSFDPDDDIALVSFSPVNRDLNPEQQLAVSSVLSIASQDQRNKAPSPYIIYGPPGTGKTVTLVESIRQLIERYPNDRILVTAPSNEAADLFISRLNALPTSEMLRLNAFSRNERAVPRAVRDYSLEDERGFVFPANIDQIGQYRVVVATCATASRLWNMLDLPRGFFRTIVCDECGHAWEPEAAAILLNGLASDDTVLVLAGDPKQLGPVVRSQVAKDAGLAVSFLERLMGMPAYSKRGPLVPDSSRGPLVPDSSHASGQGGVELASGEWRYDPTRVTKLLRNYRSHEAIIRLPNGMFYDNELVPSAHPLVSHNLVGGAWEHLKNPTFPIMFHGVMGKDEREATSPSWFNPEEANEVVNWVTLLTRDKPFVKEKDIGIISPYAKQVQKIRMLLGANGTQDIMVGSTEMFQGQERRVIIISTVRSSEEWVASDQTHNLGFLANPKRFNVAVTRAKALLIVVGNPHVLSTDPYWGGLLRLCCDNDAYVGQDFSFSSDSVSERAAEEAFVHALQDMAVRDEQGDDVGDREVPAWHAMED